MIRGVGVDLVAPARLEALEGKWDDPFFRRIFTEAERAEAAAREAEAGPRAALRYFTGRFAVKEAVVKALNTEDVVVEFPQIETLTAKTGAPTTRLVGDASPLDARFKLHVSLSHEEQLAMAIAVAEG
ncbi:MAG TPA: 4'-phosphopantetheinyl transferase superfamily protein [Candidatus Aphodovivens avistercoris]|nr:4'-phosphopantetheinyl transferase superfamily protein [Candidatus Aphodovivens avistercoris]